MNKSFKTLRQKMSKPAQKAAAIKTQKMLKEMLLQEFLTPRHCEERFFATKQSRKIKTGLLHPVKNTGFAMTPPEEAVTHLNSLDG